MKKLLLIPVFVGFVVFLLSSSGDVRSVFGWALTAYLALRAFPAVAADCRWLWRGLSSRRAFGFRTSKVGTL